MEDGVLGLGVEALQRFSRSGVRLVTRRRAPGANLLPLPARHSTRRRTSGELGLGPDESPPPLRAPLSRRRPDAGRSLCSTLTKATFFAQRRELIEVRKIAQRR